MKRKIALFSAILLSLNVLTACSDSDTTDLTVDPSASSEIIKPEKISMMANTFMTGEDNDASIAAFCKEYKRLTGVELNVVSPLHDSYYESVNISIATDNDVDVYEAGSIFYPNYAMYDLLWDMTDAWENSSIKDITEATYVDALKIDGRLYGFPLTKGNGTVTYVRKDWMEQLNIENPKTYDEFYEMLKKFKTLGDDIIPITAAGLVNSEYPYQIYLREFYQDAIPDFIIKDGKYVDGMTEPEMKDALQRMKNAYNDGLLDPDIVTNKTSACRNKFYDGLVGCFNYWAGTWGDSLDKNVKKNNPEASVEGLEPIEGVSYVERPPLALIIPKSCKNPEGVFKYFIEYSHDGGEGQMLFTRGVENYHWRKTSDTTGELILENASENVAIYLKPELCINNFIDIVPLTKGVATSTEVFNKFSNLVSLPATSKKTSSLFPDVDLTRREIIESVVTGDMTVDEGMEEYKRRSEKIVNRILQDLNNPEKNTGEED